MILLPKSLPGWYYLAPPVQLAAKYWCRAASPKACLHSLDARTGHRVRKNLDANHRVQGTGIVPIQRIEIAARGNYAPRVSRSGEHKTHRAHQRMSLGSSMMREMTEERAIALVQSSLMDGTHECITSRLVGQHFFCVFRDHETLWHVSVILAINVIIDTYRLDDGCDQESVGTPLEASREQPLEPVLKCNEAIRVSAAMRSLPRLENGRYLSPVAAVERAVLDGFGEVGDG